MSTNKPEMPNAHTRRRPGVGKACGLLLSLLDDKNLYAYHENRVATSNVNVRRQGEGAAERRQAFVNIERHILAITGSSRAKPLFVVCPPYCRQAA